MNRTMNECWCSVRSWSDGVRAGDDSIQFTSHTHSPNSWNRWRAAERQQLLGVGMQQCALLGDGYTVGSKLSGAVSFD